MLVKDHDVFKSDNFNETDCMNAFSRLSFLFLFFLVVIISMHNNHGP